MIIAALMVGSFIGTLIAGVGYFAFGISFFAALTVYLSSALAPAVLSALSVLAQMQTEDISDLVNSKS